MRDMIEEIYDSFWCSQCQEYVLTQCAANERDCVFNWGYTNNKQKNETGVGNDE